MLTLIITYIVADIWLQLILLAAVWDKIVYLEDFFSPKVFYKNTKMNIFGCFLVSIIHFLIFPIVGTIWVLYWICHVGRKN